LQAVGIIPTPLVLLSTQQPSNPRSVGGLVEFDPVPAETTATVSATSDKDAVTVARLAPTSAIASATSAID
jgi:hypothetical protein